MSGNFKTYLTVFCTALVATYFLTPLVRKLAIHFGVVDLPNERRPHKRPTARGGGLAVILGFHLACLIGLLFAGTGQIPGFSFHWWLNFLPASVVLLIVGLIDDVRGMPPRIKLMGQVAAAALVWVSGVRFGEFFGLNLPAFLDGFLVILWIVAVINAFNLIDGMDGLASGLGIISATGICGILILGQHVTGIILVPIALVGACLAFLRYNFQPASIFLGDTGSMFIGLVLGTVALQTFTKNSFFLAMTIPMLVVGVPIYDALLAIWRRSVRMILTGEGQPGKPKKGGIMQPDLDHLHHRLQRSGMSTRRTAIILYIINGGFVLLGLLVTTFQSRASGIFLIALLAAVYVLLRQMAVIELRDTGRMLLTGLRRPSHSLLKAMAYTVWDMLCLAGGLAVAMWIFEAQRLDFWRSWFLEMPVWVTPTFSLLAISRTYVTVWTRARVLDFLMLVLTLLAGILLSLGISLLIDPANALNSLLRCVVIITLSHGAIITSRMFYRVIEEVVDYLKAAKYSSANRTRILLYGAGGRCQLILKELGFGHSSAFENQTVVGLMDDEPSLHFKWVYGHQVLGGIKDLAPLISRLKVNGIVITTQLRPEMLGEIRALAAAHHLSLSEWRFENKLVPMEAPTTNTPQSAIVN